MKEKLAYVQITYSITTPAWTCMKTNQEMTCTPGGSITPFSPSENQMKTFPQSFRKFHLLRSTEKGGKKKKNAIVCCLIVKTFRVFTVSLRESMRVVKPHHNHSIYVNRSHLPDVLTLGLGLAMEIPAINSRRDGNGSWGNQDDSQCPAWLFFTVSRFWHCPVT